MQMATSFFGKLKKSGKVTFSEKPIVGSVKKELTVNDVRAKIIDNLAANKLVFNGKFKGEKKPNPNFKKLKNGTYQFSIKYGIRSLESVLEGATYVSGLDETEVNEAFDAAAEIVNSGGADKAIASAIAANKAMRAKKK
jgi:hypothetical protein